jgi:tetratricopeptide (TPR) repeat protein
MMNDPWEAVWEHIRTGHHALVYAPSAPSAAPSDLKVVRINCEAIGPRGSVLDAARYKVAQCLGEDLEPAGPTPGQLEAGLRRRLLGELPGPPLEAQLVEVCNQLSERAGGRATLMFEAIDAADMATVESLTRILSRPGWLRLPLLLTVRGEPQGPVTELINLMRQAHGDAGIFEIGGPTSTDEVAAPFAWAALAPDVLRVLRAASMFGPTFEAGMVARLLDEPLGAVLERLQGAADAGAPLADRGEGQFSVPPETIRALQSRILPSLLTFWHARLGHILSGAETTGRTTASAPYEVDTPLREPRPGARQRVSDQTGDVAEMPTVAPTTGMESARPRVSYASLFEPEPRAEAPSQLKPPEAAAEAPAELRTQASGARRRAGEAVPPPRLPEDQAQAADHLQAAGQTEAAVQQYLAAVREVASRGDAQRAYGIVEQGLKLLDDLPVSPRRALLRAQLWLEKGALQWRGALLGAPFTLQQALASLETARSSLPQDVPPDFVGRLAATIAGVCSDLGDLHSLQQALAEVTDASRQLLEANEATQAARLLNDQAAIYVRLGDPVRAAHLLEQSKTLFEGRLRNRPDDAVALEELAETHHLLARLPMHAPIRPGREADALAMSLEHAQAAERAYQHLDQRRELARVWETMGRLEGQHGQPAAAQQHLSAALTSQQQLGDVIGVARSTAALSELFRTTGRLAEALTLLDHSIRLNFEKGSPLGLAVNRHALGALADAVTQVRRPGAADLRGAVEALEHRLTQAEAVLGRMDLPGEGHS